MSATPRACCCWEEEEEEEEEAEEEEEEEEDCRLRLGLLRRPLRSVWAHGWMWLRHTWQATGREYIERASNAGAKHMSKRNDDDDDDNELLCRTRAQGHTHSHAPPSLRNCGRREPAREL